MQTPPAIPASIERSDLASPRPSGWPWRLRPRLCRECRRASRSIGKLRLLPRRLRRGDGRLSRRRSPATGPPPQLARLIAKTMPEDDPGTCVGEDAEQGRRLHPRRLLLAGRPGPEQPRPGRALPAHRPPVPQRRRRPGRQLPRAAAIGTTSAGSQGEYFKSRRLRNDERVDRPGRPRGPVRLRRGRPRRPTSSTPTSSRSAGRARSSPPRPASTSSSSAPSTPPGSGSTTRSSPLIDAWVKSGNDTEYRGDVFLLGGRAYPLRLEFSKAKQGVDDSKKKKAKPGRSRRRSRCEWKPPAPAAEVIPARNLSPGTVARGVRRRRPRSRRTTAASATSGARRSRRRGTRPRPTRRSRRPTTSRPTSRELAGVDDDAADRDGQAPRVLPRFAERAFRRPLDRRAEAAATSIASSTAAGDPETAVKRVVLLVLKSPRFLYREVGGGPTPTTWPRGSRSGSGTRCPTSRCSTPRPPAGSPTREQVARQAERMVDRPADPRQAPRVLPAVAQGRSRPRHRQGPQALPRLRRRGRRPTCGPRSTCSSTTSSGATPPTSAGSCSPTTVYLNGRLAKFYGGRPAAPTPRSRRSRSSPGERAGRADAPVPDGDVRLHRRRARRSTGASSSPGACWAARSGRRPRPSRRWPPDLHPSLTTRERVTLQTSPPPCITCHGIINPLGFALETSTPSAASGTRRRASRRRHRALRAPHGRDRDVRRGPRPGELPGRQRRGPRRLRRAVVPPPGQAAGPRLRPATAGPPPAFAGQRV